MNQVIINIKIYLDEISYWIEIAKIWQKCENYPLEKIGLPRIIHVKKERGGAKRIVEWPKGHTKEQKEIYTVLGVKQHNFRPLVLHSICHTKSRIQKTNSHT